MRYGIVTSLAILLGLGVEPGRAQEDKPAKLSPQFAAYVRNYFESVDKNKDSFLDREELAKVFRGPRAKPVGDPPAQGLGDGKDEPDAEKPEAAKPAAKGKTPARPMRIMPEDDFIKTWDSNKDGKISLHEFEHWGELFEKEMKEVQNFQQQLQRNWQQQMQNAMRRMWRR